MNELPMVPLTAGASLAPAQASTDAQLVDLWRHGRSEHTQRAYRADIERLFRHVEQPLRAITLADLQAFADSLDHLQPTSKARTLAGVKSLLSFGHRLGYLPFDVGRALRLPPLRSRLAERILDEVSVHRIIALETRPRDRAMLQLCYAAGVRVSELVALRWRDLQPREEAGQRTVYGKGGKTRAIVLPLGPWRLVQQLREAAGPDAPVFRSGAGGHLDPSQARRIVRATLGHSSVATTGKYLHARPTESSGKYLAL